MAATTQYHCPMHPTYISNQPGECPICGMELVPQSTSDSVHQHDMSSTGTVPGLVSVTIEPQRLQLTDLRTGKVELRPLANKKHLTAYVTTDETRTSNVQLRTSGWVRDLLVDQTGQYVKAG